jgi:hypothetical protein
MADLKGDRKKYKHMIYNPEPIVWQENVGTKSKQSYEIKQAFQGWRPGTYFIYENGEKWRYDSFDTVDEAKEFLEKEIGSKADSPNMLYYVIPTLLWDKHQDKILESISKEYGVITCDSYSYNSLTVQKKATKLHKNPVSKETIRKIVARMSSEIAELSRVHFLHSQSMTEYGKMLQEKFKLEDGLNEN